MTERTEVAPPEKGEARQGKNRPPKTIRIQFKLIRRAFIGALSAYALFIGATSDSLDVFSRFFELSSVKSSDSPVSNGADWSATEPRPSIASASISGALARIPTRCPTDLQSGTGSCDDPQAWMTFSSPYCTPRDFKQEFKIPEGLKLDLETYQIQARGCMVRPGVIARGVGATAATLLVAAQGEDVPPTLLKCVLSNGDEGSCLGEHVGEPISEWRPSAARIHEISDCNIDANAYTSGRTSSPIGGLSATLQDGVIDGVPSVRCVIMAERPMVSSVYKINDRPIPLMPRVHS